MSNWYKLEAHIQLPEQVSDMSDTLNIIVKALADAGFDPHKIWFEDVTLKASNATP